MTHEMWARETEEGRGRTEEPRGRGGWGGCSWAVGSLKTRCRYIQMTCIMYALLPLLKCTCQRGLGKLG